MQETSPKAQLLAILATMKSGGGDGWNDAHTQAYALGLCDVEDKDCTVLAKAILRKFAWRPSVAEIMELHDEITNPVADEAIAEIMGKLREKVVKLGPYASPDPRFPKSPNIKTAGPPPGYENWPSEVRSVVNAMGGWSDFCTNFDWNDSGDRAHFIKLYGSVKKGYSERAISTMRLEYQSNKRLSAPITEIEEEGPRDMQVSRHEAVRIMDSIGEAVKTLR